MADAMDRIRAAEENSISARSVQQRYSRSGPNQNGKAILTRGAKN